jgi:uncharacterized protein (TIGR03435 family)
MREFLGTVLVILTPLAAFGQAPAPVKKEFEVASVRLSQPSSTQVNVGVHVDGAMVACTALSVKDFIQIAYQVKNYQVEGPEWIAGERFDVNAKLPEGATRSDVPAMIQALLADRFGMKMHRESKDFPVYGLVVAKGGHKMKETPLDDEAEVSAGGRGAVNVAVSGGRNGVNLNFGRGSFFNFADNKIEGKKLSMLQFADTLARFVDRPVVNMTDLNGTYDFTLTFTPEDFRAMQIRAAIAAGVVLPPEALRLLEGATGDSLFSTIQTVGLKLESRKAPLEVLVIDSIRKTPTEN